MDDDPRTLAAFLTAAQRIVVFTGAGISTESGIPDFRSPGGVWDKMPPVYFEEFLSSQEMRNETWRRRFAMTEMFGTAKPNAGHLAIAELVRRGKVTHVITQNIDGLHQAAGVPAAKVIELHGNTTYATCLACGLRYEIHAMREPFDSKGSVPDCFCGGYIKPATISFGQPMPEEAMRLAQAATLACDFFLVAGSSLVVYPAAAFPLAAKREGAGLAILNRTPTDQDKYADLVIREGIGATLRAALALL
jgi:NAD-dependent protein deacetylase/lipoamidase